MEVRVNAIQRSDSMEEIDEKEQRMAFERSQLANRFTETNVFDRNLSF